MLQYRDMLPRTALSATGGTWISSELQRRYIRSIVMILSGARLNGLLGHRLGRSTKQEADPIDRILYELEDQTDDAVEETSEAVRLEQAFVEKPSMGHDHLGRAV
jgi:hypothetical protein